MIQHGAQDGAQNLLLHYRDLFHQVVVDMYVKIESESLNYIRFNQAQLRSEKYIHLYDAMNYDDADPNQVGQKVILTLSFTGSPRHMHKYAQDAMAYVRKYGRPDLFIIHFIIISPAIQIGLPSPVFFFKTNLLSTDMT